MDQKCKGCGEPNTDDCLTPEGLCWTCDKADEGIPNVDNVRSAMDNVARGLADKVGSTKATTKRRMYEAATGGHSN